jgi:sodium-coupled neutral amino acid transporter 11
LTPASTENVLFSVEGDEDEHETSALEDTHRRSKADQTVRFEEQVQVIAPPLRSTAQSREAGMYCTVIVIVFRVAHLSLFIDVGQLLRGCARKLYIEFELDSDDLDDDAIAQTNFDHDIRSSDPNREQSMPLLVGLLDASAVRRSLDIPMGMGVDYAPEYSDVDVEELVAKQSAGGGMLSSMANMANSILGAGVYPYPLPLAMADISPSFLSSRDHRYIIRSCYYIPTILNISSGLPYAMSRAGFFMGIFLLVILSAITDWTIRLIVINAKLSGTKSYIEIMNRCFGSSGRAAVSFFQFAFAFGGTYVCHDTLRTCLLIHCYRDVRFWNHHWCASVLYFGCHFVTQICC